MFNGFLRELKAELIGTRYSSFWSVNVVNEGVTLVDSSQCAASALSAEETKKVSSSSNRSNYSRASIIRTPLSQATYLSIRISDFQWTYQPLLFDAHLKYYFASLDNRGCTVYI